MRLVMLENKRKTVWGAAAICSLLIVAGCQRATNPAAPKVNGKTLQQWAEQAAAPLKPSIGVDPHGRDAHARQQRDFAFRQIETFGSPAIAVLLQLRSHPDDDISRQATRALQNIGKHIDLEAELVLPLLVEVLENSDRSDVSAWSEASLRSIGEGVPAVKAMVAPLSDRKLRSSVVLDIGGWPDWRQRMLRDIRQHDQSSSRTADYAELERLVSQIVSYQLNVKNNVGTRDLPPVGDLVEQVKSRQNLLGSLSGLYRIAEANATVDDLDLGPATPDLTEAVPALTEVAGGNQAGIVVLAIKTIGLIGQDAQTALPVLIQQLKSANYDIRAESAAALGGIGITDRSVVEALIASLDTEITTPVMGNRRPPGLPRGTRGANANWRSRLPPGTLSRNVAVSLGRIAAHPDISVPALLNLRDFHVMPGLIDQDPVSTALGAFGQDSRVAINPLIDSLGATSFSQSALETLREIDPGLQSTIQQLSDRLSDADEHERIQAARVLLRFARNRNPATAPAERVAFGRWAVPALEAAAAREEKPLSQWAAYALWRYDPSSHNPAPALPILIEALEEPKQQHLRKSTVLSDLAEMGPKGKPASASIVKAIERGDFGDTGAMQLLKIDPVAALQAGLVTGLSPENLPSTILQPLGALEPYFEREHPNFRREFDTSGNLVLLRLRSARLTDDDLAGIVSYSGLRVIDLSYNEELTDEGLGSLATLRNLRSIDLTGCKVIGDALLEKLTKLPNLETLTLTKTSVTADGLRHFAETHPQAVDPETLNAVEVLGLDRIQRYGLRGKLGSDFRLKELAFSGKRITEDSFARILAGQDSLKSLTVYRTVPFADSWFAHLSNCPNLELLNLKYCEGLSTETFSAIGGLNRLKTLDLEGTRIGDAELTHLHGLIQLEELNLTNCYPVTDRGIAALLELKKLRKLHLRGCRGVTTNSLQVLVSMPELEFVNLSGVAKSVLESEECQRALPNCRIQF